MAKATRNASGPVVRAVYWALNVPAITATLKAGVYGDVPQNTPPPYVRIEADDRAWNTMGLAGADGTITLHVFSNTSRNLDDIVSAAVSLLAGVRLAVVGFSTDRLQYEQTIRGEDEVLNGVKVFHKVMTFRVWLREAA